MGRPFAIALLALAAALPARAQPQATFAFPRSADFLMLEYRQTHEMLEPDPIPLLRIYGDGRVLVHQPSYRIDAGDYELKLSPNELMKLIESLVAQSVPGLSVSDLARARQEAEDLRAAAEHTFFTISDATVTEIDLRLELFTPAPGARAVGDLHQRIVWANLQSDAQRYPALLELTELAAAERELRALLDRSDLVRRQN